MLRMPFQGSMIRWSTGISRVFRGMWRMRDIVTSFTSGCACTTPPIIWCRFWWTFSIVSRVLACRSNVCAQRSYQHLLPQLLKGEHTPKSPVILRQVANKMNDWDDHGTPILLRGLRTLLHEEKLLASQDAIAERLYSQIGRAS